MTNALPPRTRARIINYDPTQPGALSASEFCKSVKISRSVFYKIRTLAATESAAALHPRSRAPKQPARRYGKDVVNELVRIRHALRGDGWDYGPRSIYYEATQLDQFPGGPGSLGRVDREAPRECRAGGCGAKETPQVIVCAIRAVDRDGVVAA